MQEETGDGDGFKVPKAAPGEGPSASKKANNKQGIWHTGALRKV